MKELKHLWLQNSNNKFGISIQAEIYQSLGSPSYPNDNWDIFCERVGWKQGYWLSYYELMKKFELKNEAMPQEALSAASLPALIYTLRDRALKNTLLRGRRGRGLAGMSCFRISSLAQRFVKSNF